MSWLYFAFVQLIMGIFAILGWLLLIPFCVAHGWKPDGKIDRWSWAPLNWIYGNREDGVSGQRALIWNPQGTARVPYLPEASAWWRAYCWSGWRNSTDNLKYVFAWEAGPLYEHGSFKAGWQRENGLKVPVLSL